MRAWHVVAVVAFLCQRKPQAVAGGAENINALPKAFPQNEVKLFQDCDGNLHINEREHIDHC